MTNGNGALRTFERNRFFYGKLMDVRQWQLEQDYGIDARRLLSRLGLGTGVICGLGVSVAADGCLWIEPGVAIDGMGREIVVTSGYCLEHPEQPTDCHGKPEGEAVTTGEVTVALCYHECLTESVPAIACGCETSERCEASIVAERYCIRVVRGVPAAREPFPCELVNPAPPPESFDRRHAVFDVLGGACPPATDDCVTLATVTFAPEKPPLVDAFTYRRTIYSNQALFELILCVAARVDECCQNGHPPALAPPRVSRVWPRDREVLTTVQAERDSFLKSPRVELTFERVMEAAVLSAPDSWLRAWSFVPNEDTLIARRIALALEDPPAQPAFPGPSGSEQLVVYRFDNRFKKEARRARVLIQLRPDEGGPIVVDTSATPVLLDGEHRGTGLSTAHLDDLWSNVIDPAQRIPVDPSIWDNLMSASPPAFPSGDGSEGGALDLAFAFDLPPVEHGPQLLALWPPNSSYIRQSSVASDEEREWWSIFYEYNRLELTFDDTLDVNSIAALPADDWVRLWRLIPEGTGFVPRRLPLDFGGDTNQPLLPAPAGSVTIQLKTDLPEGEMVRRSHLVAIILADKAGLDADFDGVGLTPAQVDDLWNDDVWPAGVTPSGPTSIGATLADGVPGGVAVAFFDYANDTDD